MTPEPAVAPTPAVSVVIGTRNRAALLADAITSLVDGTPPGFGWELIVVDNGSTDGTRAMLDGLMAGGAPIRYIHEPGEGVWRARNAGIAAARAPVVAFMDDDQMAGHGWVAVIHETLTGAPSLDFVCGPVRALWESPRPPWLEGPVLGAISILDRGLAPLPIDASHWMCLPGGNMACRRAVLEALGGFAPYRRSQDRELTVRLLLRGRRGRYEPAMIMGHRVSGDRCTRRHARRWHATEGRMRAGYQFLELFDREGGIRPPDPGRPMFLGVSRFVYRDLAAEFGRMVGAALRARPGDAFGHELRVRYTWHYILGRVVSRSRDDSRGGSGGRGAAAAAARGTGEGAGRPRTDDRDLRGVRDHHA